MEKWSECVVRDAFVAGVCTIVFDVIDGVDDESVEGSEVESEWSGFKLSKAVSAREVTAEVDVKGKCGLLQEEKDRVDGGIW